MERIKFIIYKEKSVLFLDASHITLDEGGEFIEAAEKTITSSPKHSLLVLVNVAKAQFNIRTLEGMRRIMNIEHDYAKKVAMFGVGDIQRKALAALIRITKSDLTIFKNEEEAKEWLIE